ncbi:alpha/beta hydrolase, partial [Halomonas sp. BBD48]|nr:alpha/beta hydrolase [Halomonas sp. BBD48]
MFKAIGFAIGGIALVTLLAWGLTVWIARRVEAAIPPAGRFIDLPGIRLHVVEKGQGRPVILLHGIGGQLRHFTYALVDRLADDFHVVAVDRPGMG